MLDGMIVGCCNASPLELKVAPTSIWQLEDPSDGRMVYFLSEAGAEHGKAQALQQRADWFVSFLMEYKEFFIKQDMIVGRAIADPEELAGVSADAPADALPGLLAWLNAGCPADNAIHWTEVCYPHCDHVITKLTAYP